MKIDVILSIFALTVLFSCQREAELQVEESYNMVFVATLSEGPQTKTIRQADGKVFWSTNEEIHVFQGARKGKFVSQNVEESSMTTFVGNFDSSVDDGSDYWAVYPWQSDNSFIGWAVYVPILSHQIAKAGSFEDGVFPSIAKSSTNELSFYNICGGVKFRVFNSGIKQVIFKGNNNEVIAGHALVTFSEGGTPCLQGDILSSISSPASRQIYVTAPDNGTFTPGEYYYIVIPPLTFTEGFSLIFCNEENKEATFTTNKSITVTRSKFGVLNDLDQDLVFSEGEEAMRVNERNALIAIYNSLNGENWSQQSDWLSDSPVGAWAGVTTDDNGFVTSLWLYDSNIAGSIPNEISQLTHLKYLMIYGGVSGTIPEGICDIECLEEISIQNSSIGGVLPDRIGDLINLHTLSLTPFNGEGTIPTSLSSLVNLSILELSEFDLNQNIPECVLALENLTTLSMPACGLSGDIPSELGSLSNLQSLNLSGNELSGSIPSELGSLSNLQILDLSGNELSGSIPSQLGSLSNLQSLKLSRNNLSGTIPDDIGLLDELLVLDLGGNAFTGFPSTLSQCDALEVVYLSGNSAPMVLNNDIWSAPSLAILDLSNSNISGTLSSDIGNAVVLSSLHLYRNQLSGELPSEMANMLNLRSLDIHNNQFTGSLPDSFSALTELESFIAYNNYMSGPICEEIVFMEVFNKWQLTPQYNDGEFTYSMYESSDYTGHKTVSQLRTSAVGEGINIVLMGEAYTDRDIAEGTYDYAMNLACDALFEVEPFKSYENRFNVYAVKLVSRNGHVMGETALGIDYDPFLGSGGYSGYNKAFDIVNEVIPGLDMEQLTIGVIVNNLQNGGACSNCWLGSSMNTPYGSGRSVSVIPNAYVGGTEGIDMFKYTVIHEVIGHGFGKLGDEYATYESSISDSNHDWIEQVQSGFGWVMNVSVTNDPELVPWKAFLALPAYVNDGITIIEGGYDCTYGVWRPTSSSIMSCDYENYPYFNAPSRQAIYRRIHLISDGPGWTYSFDDFIEWDAKNLQNP